MWTNPSIIPPSWITEGVFLKKACFLLEIHKAKQYLAEILI